MSDYIVKAMSDLYSNVSFGGGGGGGRGSGGVSTPSRSKPSGSVTLAQGKAQGIADTLNGLIGNSYIAGANPSDPQGAWGRPDSSQGDSYSGNSTYGGASGR